MGQNYATISNTSLARVTGIAGRAMLLAVRFIVNASWRCMVIITPMPSNADWNYSHSSAPHSFGLRKGSLGSRIGREQEEIEWSEASDANPAPIPPLPLAPRALTPALTRWGQKPRFE